MLLELIGYVGFAFVTGLGTGWVTYCVRKAIKRVPC